MVWGRVFDIAAAIVVVTGIGIALTSPETRGVINSVLGGYIGALQAAGGRAPTGFYAGAH